MQNIVQFLKNINQTKLLSLGIGAALILLGLIFIVLNSNKGEMSLLYSELDQQDSAKIIEFLEKEAIEYVVNDSGSSIKIPRSKVAKVRVKLASMSIPSNGSMIGYEIFDKEDSIGTTNFAQNVKMTRALEGEIVRTINTFDQVEKTRVHIVLPQKEMFSKEKIEPKASLVIKFRNGGRFNKDEIEAVSNLVVTAVPGLTSKNITIVDTAGNSLKIGSKEDTNNHSAKSDEYKLVYENKLKKSIEELLDHSLGTGKAKVQIAAEMNFDRTVINSEAYDPDSSVVRSSQNIDEKESSPAGNNDNLDMSSINNIPGGNNEMLQMQNLAIKEKNEQTLNYEISKTIKNQIIESGIVTKLSIGVVLDGTYKLNKETNKVEYTPRTPEELGKIKNLIKASVGFDEKRGDVIEIANLQFSNVSDILNDENDFDWLKEDLPEIFQTVVFAIVLLLVLITVVRPITIRLLDTKNPNLVREAGSELGAGNEASMGPLDSGFENMAPDGANAKQNISNDVIAQMIDAKTKKVNDLAVSHPQEVLNVLRKWLDEGR